MSPVTPLAGAPSTFTIHVEPTSGFDCLDGGVSLVLDGATVADSIPLVNGVATYAGSTRFSGSSRSVDFYAVTGTSLSAVAVSGLPVVGVSRSNPEHGAGERDGGTTRQSKTPRLRERPGRFFLRSEEPGTNRG